MVKSASQKKYSILLWIARIWSILSIGFLVFMIGAHFLNGDFGNFNHSREILLFAFFPVGVILGLLIAWLKPGLGGSLAILSLLAFRITANEIDFNFWIDGLAAPGFLFFLYWSITKKRKKNSPAD